MTLQITVRGSAEERVAPQRAVLSLAVVVEGPAKDQVRDEARAAHGPLVEQLERLASEGAVERWSSDDVRVHAHRPWVDGRRTEEPVHTARLGAVAKFVDFDALDGFVDDWSGRPGVELRGIDWQIDQPTRRTREHEVRRAAVEDAVTKAQAYADAVRRGRVTAVQLADPDMLDAGSGEGASGRAYALASSDWMGGDEPLRLVPADVILRVEVDARFTAE